MYCIFSTKGNNHPMAAQTFTFSPWSSDQASSGKCLYTSPVLSTADLLKRPNVKPLREVVADGSHRYVEEMVNRWLMISRDSRVSIYLYSYHIHTVCGSKSKTEDTLTHVVCNVYLFLTGIHNRQPCLSLRLFGTNARFVFRVGKINIPIHKVRP